MQLPPDSRKARAGVSSPESGSAVNKSQNLDNEQDILTVIPVDERWWCIKARYANGESICLPDRFGSRLEALGAAVLRAQHLGTRVEP